MNEEIERRLREKAAKFEQALEPVREPGFELPEMKELPWQETLSFVLVDIYDCIKKAKKMIEARTPTYQRIAMRVLKNIEALIMIAGWFASRKFKFFSNLAGMFRKGA